MTIDHGGGLLSTCSFLSSLLVHKGDLVAQGQVVALAGAGHAGDTDTERPPRRAPERPVRRSARLPQPREAGRPHPARARRLRGGRASLRRAPPRMARLCATPGSFPHVDAASSRARSSSSRCWSGEAGSSSRRPRPRPSAGGRRRRATRATRGRSPMRPSRRIGRSWHLDVPLGGPAGDFGLSQPVSDGSSVIAVGPTQIVAADLGTGAQRWTVDRDYGPPVSPAIAGTPSRRILIYTEGFGDSPPGSSATPSARRPSLARARRRRHRAAVRSTRMSRRSTSTRASPRGTRRSRCTRSVEPASRSTGTPRSSATTRGHVYAVAVATGEIRWTADAGRVPDDASGGLERPRDRGRSR